PQLVLELVEGLRPAVVVAGAPQAVAGELLGGVAGGGLLQGPLAAPLGHADPDLRAPGLAQPALVEVGIVGVRRHEDGLGQPQGLGLTVEALEHVADELAGAEVLDLVDDEALPPDDPAPAHEEDRVGRLELALARAEPAE